MKVQHPRSEIRDPRSEIRHSTSEIRDPKSGIRHPIDIQHLTSHIPHPGAWVLSFPFTCSKCGLQFFFLCMFISVQYCECVLPEYVPTFRGIQKILFRYAPHYGIILHTSYSANRPAVTLQSHSNANYSHLISCSQGENISSVLPFLFSSQRVVYISFM